MLCTPINIAFPIILCHSLTKYTTETTFSQLTRQNVWNFWADRWNRRMLIKEKHVSYCQGKTKVCVK